MPDRLVGELARFACRSGSKGMDKVVTDFTAVHPEASKRQVEKKIQEVAYKEKRAGDVRDSWYIRPGFESLLDETLDHQHHSGEASPADAEAKDRAKVRECCMTEDRNPSHHCKINVKKFCCLFLMALGRNTAETFTMSFFQPIIRLLSVGLGRLSPPHTSPPPPTPVAPHIPVLPLPPPSHPSSTPPAPSARPSVRTA